VAESCTGGWISKLLTDAPGSSSWFDRCIVAYSNQAKIELLGLQQTLLDAEGAVSRSAVEAMVRALQARTSASVALAVSGISGPSGGTPEKPVGTVHLAIAIRGGSILPAQFRFHGDRDAVRRQSVDAALRLIAQIRVD
jgi:nicotinamide-nucleotide amidase